MHKDHINVEEHKNPINMQHSGHFGVKGIEGGSTQLPDDCHPETFKKEEMPMSDSPDPKHAVYKR